MIKCSYLKDTGYYTRFSRWQTAIMPVILPTVLCRNRDHHKRPSVLSVSNVLSGPSEPLLRVPEEEVQGVLDNTRATQLGAPLEYGSLLYTDLQQYYNTN